MPFDYETFFLTLSKNYTQSNIAAQLMLLDFCYKNKLLEWRPTSLWEQEKKIALIKGILDTEHLSEPIVELGVFQGGGTFFLANFLQSINSTRKVYGADSFDGLPDPCEKDKIPSKSDQIHYIKGMFKETSFETLNFQAKIWGFSDTIKFYKGYFDDILTESSDLNRKYSIAIIDPDQYLGCKRCLNYFYGKVVSGGFVFIDDYRGTLAEGVNQAVDEFMEDKPESMIQGGGTMWYFIKK